MDKTSDKKKYNRILVEDIPTALTFDDVLMVPQYSDINSRFDISLNTLFSRRIPLKIPLVSSPMDTVTEDQMAIEMARNGGLGVIHRFQSITDQAKMISKVKRAETHVIIDPVTVYKHATVSELRSLMRFHKVNTFLVIDSEYKQKDSDFPKRKKSEAYDQLIGIVTNRDIRSSTSESDLISDIMTPREKLFAHEIIGYNFPKEDILMKIMNEKKIEKIPLVSAKNEIMGLVTMKDILRTKDRPIANTDISGQLYVGGSVGAKEDFEERSLALIEAGCDVLVVDIANGHSQLCIDTVQILKDRFPNTDIVAGSVASGEGAEKLIRAGADGIRCGIGNGSICITRIVAGSGVPQLSALFDVAPICKEYEIPLISDGGNRNSGNMCKALGAGADCIMLGRLVAGCEESPSKILYKEGKLTKVYRGMAGLGANISKSQRISGTETVNANFNAEGVEGYIPYAGPLKDVLNQFSCGIRSGMSYSGARTIQEHQEKVKFIRITHSGSRESGVHDIKQF